MNEVLITLNSKDGGAGAANRTYVQYRQKLWKLYLAFHKKEDIYATESDVPRCFPPMGNGSITIKDLDEQLTNDSNYMTLLLVDDEPVGFVGYAASPHTEWNLAYTHIMTLYVDPNFRKRGYGRKLVQVALDFAKEQKHASVTIGVLFKNWPARSLYDAIGFKPYHQTMGLNL